ELHGVGDFHDAIRNDDIRLRGGFTGRRIGIVELALIGDAATRREAGEEVGEIIRGPEGGRILRREDDLASDREWIGNRRTRCNTRWADDACWCGRRVAGWRSNTIRERL